ncbi:MAG: LemA family protein [Bacteroidales bacterium]|nr:LemA family protein [Bacteroidales bacterium]MCF8455018.1 LemA family protein [Bacteroidales bacterium]
MYTDYIIYGIVGLVILIIIGLYNTIIRKRNEVNNAFASIDAMLKKRYDLLPNLVELVKQYMAHEKTVFVEITKLRSQVSSEIPSDEKLEKYNALQKHADRLLLNVENYPDLKASANFLHLQASWNSTEEQISASRRYFNAAVTDYNNHIQMFPYNILADLLKFSPQSVFEISNNERQNINAKELFNS